MIGRAAQSQLKKIPGAVAGWWGKGAAGAGKAMKGGGGFDNAQGLITGIAIPQAKKHPYLAAAGALGTVALGKDVGAEWWDELGDRSRGQTTIDAGIRAKRAREEFMTRKLQEIEASRLERSIMRNAARLASTNPQMYGEVMAGRRLPKGAVVFGGQPRTDLMQQLAMDMAQGEYPEQKSPEDQLAQLFGGLQ